MKLFRFSIAPLALVLASCATSWHSAEAIPAKPEIAGVYDIQGDGLGVCMTIALNANGQYRAINCGGLHRGDASSETSGSWQLEKNHIFFYDAKGRYDASAYLNYAEIFYHHGVPAFVLARHLHNGKVHEWFVFTKQPRGEA
ncbi:MAG: hypothetical protein U1F19_06285 [Lysobacterales bacterium]